MDENELLIDLTYRAGQPLKKKSDVSSYEQDKDLAVSLYKQGVPGAVELVLGNIGKFLPAGSKPENKYNKIKELYISGSSVKKARAIIEKETEDSLRLKVLPYLSYSVLKDFKLAIKDATGSGKITKGKIEVIEEAFKLSAEEKKDNDKFVNSAAADEQTEEAVEAPENVELEAEDAEAGENTSEQDEVEAVETEEEEAAEENEDGQKEDVPGDSDDEEPSTEKYDLKYDIKGLSDTEIIDLLIVKSDVTALVEFSKEKEEELGAYDKFKIKNYLKYCLYHADFNEKAFLDEILHALKDIEGNNLWLCDYSFWQSLRPELFDVVVRFIAGNFDFYDIAYVNMQVAKAQGDNPLLLKWMEMYVKIGLGSGDNGEEFQKNYKRIQRDGALGERGISLLNALIFDQALAYKRLFEAEHDKCLSIEDRVFVRVSNGISEQLDRLEEFMSGDYQNTMKPDEYRKTIMTLIGSLRRGMDKCGLSYVVSPTDWSTGALIDYEKGDHVEFKNEAEEGDKVKPLTLGLSVNNGTYIQPAKVMKKS